APTAQRERLVKNPGLFVQALDSRTQDAEAKRLAEGPEGAWCKDLLVSEKIFRRLTTLAPTLFFPQQALRDRDRLQQPYARTKAQFQRLEQVLGQVIGHDPL
ncbi:MAG: hypothetical protein GY701_23460, partial [Sulfitobacter sp.]|nr:hypothetical protein [Sulfitobacter sp.]